MQRESFHEIAREIAKREGKKKQVNIAQICEILRIYEEIVSERTVNYWDDLVDPVVVGHLDKKKPKKKPKKTTKKPLRKNSKKPGGDGAGNG